MQLNSLLTRTSQRCPAYIGLVITSGSSEAPVHDFAGAIEVARLPSAGCSFASWHDFAQQTPNSLLRGGVELTRRAPELKLAAKPLDSRLCGSPAHLWHGFALALVFKMPTPKARQESGSICGALAHAIRYPIRKLNSRTLAQASHVAFENRVRAMTGHIRLQGSCCGILGMLGMRGHAESAILGQGFVQSHSWSGCFCPTGDP